MIAKQERILKKFKVLSSLSTNNMHLFGPEGAIEKHDNSKRIIEDFYGIRLELYKKRKRVLLENLEYHLNQLDNKVRFILGVVNGEIIVRNRKRVELYLELQLKGFDLIPPKTKNGAATSKPDDAAEENENDDSSELPRDEGVLARGYAYLLTMPIGSQIVENVQELCKEKEKLEAKVLALRNAPEESLWLKDFEAFQKKLDEQDVLIIAEEARMALKHTNEASTSISVSSSPTSSMENMPELAKLKGKGSPIKAPAKGMPALVDNGQYKGQKKAAAKPAATAPKKIGPTKKQTLTTETLKPAENFGISAKKKVWRF